MVDRRLAWLAGIVAIWGGPSLQHHLAAGDPSPGVCEAGDGAPGSGGGRSGATGHDLRPQRAAVAMSVPVESVSIDPLRAPDLGVASELLALVLHMDRTAALRQDEVGSRQPPRVSVG